MEGGASAITIMGDICACAPAGGGAQQSCAGSVGVARAFEEHVEGILERGVVAAAELVMVGGILAAAGGEVGVGNEPRAAVKTQYSRGERTAPSRRPFSTAYSDDMAPGREVRMRLRLPVYILAMACM